jgi:hypothetical protein
LINPESLDIKCTPKVTESRLRNVDYRDGGYVLQAHHDELDILSASGKSALFYSNDGLTSDDRESSYGWRNIQQLLAIYKNNGMNMNSRPGRKGTALIDSVGKMLIVYDGFLYRGSFESFSINELADKPFNLEFSFDFKITSKTSTQQQSFNIYQSVLISNEQFRRTS